MLGNSLLDWAETNHIITLFPQASNDPVTGHCWDWYGQTGKNFDTNEGMQITAVNRMVAALDKIATSPWPH